MNIFKNLYCRIYQGVFKLALPLLPYREPVILKTNTDVANVLKASENKAVLLVTDKGLSSLQLYFPLVERLKENNIEVFVYDQTVPNPTTDNVDEALKLYKDNNCTAIIGFGGGSPIDCAKGVAALLANPTKTLSQMKGVLKVRKKTPLLIAVPTTAGTGSETTVAAVITDSKTRHKYAINDFPLIPSFALLDASLTVGLPKSITATTGLDALTHAIEAYIGRSTTKQTRKAALMAIKAIYNYLPIAYEHGKNLEAREKLLIAAYNAGVAFTKSYVGNVHAIAHTLGGKYNTPHGLANAVILPYLLEYYGKSIHKKLREIGLYIGILDESVSPEDGAKFVIKKLKNLNESLNIPKTLDMIEEKDIPSLARTAEKEANPLYPVPVIMSRKEFEKMYLKIKNGK